MKKNWLLNKTNKTGILIIVFLLIALVGCVNTDNVTVIVENSSDINSDNNIDANNSATLTTKVLLVTGEYIPYTSDNLNEKGFFTQIVTSVMNDMGIPCEIKFYPWGRCTQMVKSGEAWASFPFAHSEEHDRDYFTSDTIYPSAHKYYYLKDNSKIKDEVHAFKTTSDFKKYIFGGANGYWYGSKEDFLNKGITTEWAQDTDSLVKMLFTKRIDFFIEDSAVCMEAIERLYPNAVNKFATLENDARKLDYLLLISKAYPNSKILMEKFNASLKKLKEEGTIKNILDKNGIH